MSTDFMIGLPIYIVGFFITYSLGITISYFEDKKRLKKVYPLDQDSLIAIGLISFIWPVSVPFFLLAVPILLICNLIHKTIFRWFVPTILLLLFLPKPLLAETIEIEYIDENRQSYNGCGVIYSSTICITAGHITNFKSNEPVIIKKDRKAINGTVKYVDSTADIAIIVLEKEIEVPTLVVSNGLAEQEVVQVDCFARSRKLVYTSIGTNDVDGTEVYVFDGKVEPGMSGSPIYDSRKRLVSIVSGYAKKYNETVGCHPRSIKKALENVSR